MTGNTRVDVSSGWPFALPDLELYHIVVFCSKKIYFIGYNAAASSFSPDYLCSPKNT
jgi:hypothetical protein